MTLRGTVAIGIETPLTRYGIFDGLIIDATGIESRISLNGGTQHLRFINGEVEKVRRHLRHKHVLS
ncbi:MAG: hypothetical protein ABI618_09290 [Nitrospirota bacterium]